MRQFEARVVAHHGDAQKYVQEIVAKRPVFNVGS
jgi:hypothetical protein